MEKKNCRHPLWYIYIYTCMLVQKPTYLKRDYLPFLSNRFDCFLAYNYPLLSSKRVVKIELRRRELDIKSIHIRKWPNIGKNPITLDTSCKNTFDRDILVSMSILGFIHRNAISIPCLHSSFSTFLDNCVVHLGSDKWLTMRLRYFLRLMIIKSFLFLLFFNSQWNS